MKITFAITLALLLAAAAGGAPAQQFNTMRGSDAASADRAPDEKLYQGKRPGQQQLIVRSFKEEPPLIPHTMVNYEEISATENPCWDCHISDDLNGKKMPRVGNSHLVPGKLASDGSPVLNMTRWQCNSCHVPQADAKPLVENLFGAVPRGR